MCQWKANTARSVVRRQDYLAKKKKIHLAVLSRWDILPLHSEESCSLVNATNEGCYSEKEEIAFPIDRQYVSVYFFSQRLWNLYKLMPTTFISL